MRGHLEGSRLFLRVARRSTTVFLAALAALVAFGCSDSIDRIQTSSEWIDVEVDAEPAVFELRRRLEADIEGAKPGRVRLIIPRQDRGQWLAELDALDAHPIAIEHPLPRTRRAANGYTAPNEVQARLEAIAAANPDLAVVFDGGRTVQGQTMWGIRLGSQIDERRGRPAIRLQGAIHGDEWSSMEVVFAALETLSGGYGSNTNMTALLNRVEIVAIPIVNPDGVASNTRRNANSVDLNRNHDYQWSILEWGSGPAPFSEPETRAIRDLSYRRSMIHGQSHHGGAVNCGWAYNYTTADTPDEARLAAACDTYALATATPGFWTTNGAAWYATRGDTNDWSYGRVGVQDYTVEDTEVKTPPEAEIPTFTGWHVPAVIAMMSDAVGAGLEGFAYDGATGWPLGVHVTTDSTPWPMVSDPDTGYFFRITSGESTGATLSHPGYQSGLISVGPTSPPRLESASLAPQVSTSSLDDLTPRGHLAGQSAATAYGANLQAFSGADVLVWRPHVGSSALVVGSVLSASTTQLDLALDLAGLEPGLWDMGIAGGPWLPRAVVVESPTLPALPATLEAGTVANEVIVTGALDVGVELFALGPSGAIAVSHSVDRSAGNPLYATLNSPTGAPPLPDNTDFDLVVFSRAGYTVIEDALFRNADSWWFDTGPGDDDASPSASPTPSGSPAEHWFEPGDVRLEAGCGCTTNQRTGSNWPFPLFLFAFLWRRHS